MLTITNTVCFSYEGSIVNIVRFTKGLLAQNFR